MSTNEKSISFGTAAILIYDESLLAGRDSEFYKWLKENGFQCGGGKGFFKGCCWIYANLNNRTYAFGMPGIRVTQELGGHAVTIEEFKEIFNIFEKYKGKDPLKF